MSQPEERVPLFGSWHRAYLVIVIIFVVEVGLFYFLERAFS